jgi:hypothetical protein
MQKNRRGAMSLSLEGRRPDQLGEMTVASATEGAWSGNVFQTTKFRRVVPARVVPARKLRLKIAVAFAISGYWVFVSGSVFLMALTAVRIAH